MISLDKSCIPADKLDDPRLAEWEEAVLKSVHEESYRRRTCLHEAAHAIYMERAGALRVTLHPPVAFYDPESDQFDVGLAAVQADFGQVPVETDSGAMARWSVAGGVALRLLIGGDEWGDEGGDQQDFKVFSAECQRYGLPAEQISVHWEQAKRDVENDLRSPSFRREVWDRAGKIERELLSWAEA